MSTQKTTLTLDHLDTPLGQMRIVQDEAGCLRALDWSDYKDRMSEALDKRFEKKKWRMEAGDGSGKIVQALNAYFAGDLNALDDLPVKADGTDFQQRVWAQLRKIPCGETISYGELARRIGNPKASRAVGLANGSNPIGIVVPCHRVIGANGKLTGYGSGIERKRWLLQHEGLALSA